MHKFKPASQRNGAYLVISRSVPSGNALQLKEAEVCFDLRMFSRN